MAMVLATASTSSNGSMLDALSSAMRTTIDQLDILNHPDELLNRLSEVGQVQAGVLVIVGLLCILNGYRWHRWVVVILAFLGGIMLGKLMGDQMGKSSVVAVAIGLLFALIATPMLKLSVAALGGMTGAFVGANAWTAFNTTMPEAHWAGAAMGFIAMALVSFILFKLAIMLFTSVGGAGMILCGALALLLQVESWEPAVREHLTAHDALVPLLLAVAAVSGFVVQHSRTTQSDIAEEG